MTTLNASSRRTNVVMSKISSVAQNPQLKFSLTVCVAVYAAAKIVSTATSQIHFVENEVKLIFKWISDFKNQKA